jgi:16S rRNA (guanine527-N7)-methyltransferase
MSPSTVFLRELESALIEYGVQVDRSQIDKLAQHYELMIAWNRRINLTRVTKPADAARLHYAESLYGARFIGQATSLVDIGSGAGFPAVPLAISHGQVEVTALEANKKKAVFLSEVKDLLGLTNLKIVGSRLEAFPLDQFDLVTSRALDNAEKLLPNVAERLKDGQRLMIYCGQDLADALRRNCPQINLHSIPASKNRFIALIPAPTPGCAGSRLTEAG